MRICHFFLQLIILMTFISCGSGSKLSSEISITVRNKSSLTALSLSQSKVTVSQSEIALNNSLKITVTLLTNSGTPFISDAVTVALSSSGGTSEGTLSSVTSVGDGTYEATFTGTKTGTALTIEAKVNDKSLTSTAPSITVVEGNSSVATSTLSLSSSSIVSGTTASVTLRAKDSAGNNLTKGGLRVAFSHSGGTSTGTFSSVTDNNDGTYTATFTGIVAGSATTIGATIEGASIVSSLPTVTVSAGSYSVAQSTISVSASSVASGSSVTITLTAKDLNGNQLPGGGLTVLFSTSGGTSAGTLGTVSDNLDGTYSVTFTGTTSGTAKTVSATIEGNSVTSTLPTVSVSTGVYTLAQSTVTVSAATVTSGSSITVTLRAKDSNSNQLSSGGLVVLFSTSGGTSTGTWSGVTDNNNGTYTATFTGVTAGTATTIGATIGGLAVTSALPTETVTVGAPSSIAISGSGNNQSAAVGTLLGTTLDVVVKDANNNLLSGINVDWSVTGGGGSLSLCTATTNASGVSNCSYTLGTTPGANTITATVNSTAITTSFSETATVGAAAKLLFVQQPSNTASGSTISPSITVRATDSYNNTVTAYATNIDIAIDTNPSTGTLSGTVSKAPASGVSTFDNLSLNYNGTGYKLIASSGALTTATSSAFNITATAVSYDWPFDAGSEASYSLGTGIDFTGGVARLSPSDQIDDDNSATGYLSGTPYGVSYGTLGDSTSGLKLASNGGCDGTSTNCSELDSSWTPQYATLTSYLKMNNSWTDSVGSKTVSNQNGITFSSSAKVGSHAGSFDGNNDYLELIDSINPTKYTYMMWVKFNSLGSVVNLFYRTNNGTGYSHQIRYDSGHFVHYLFDGGMQTLVGTTPITTGIWYHVAITAQNNGLMNLYVNGKIDCTSASFGTLWAGGDRYYIGGIGYFLNGYMDELAIWNDTVLTASEIETIYNRQSAKFSGLFTSRIMNGYNSTSTWTNLSWLTTLPFGKGLPDAACPVAGTPCAHSKSENSTSYSSLVGSTDSTSDNNLMSNIAALWHFEETSGTVTDDSGHGYHLTVNGSPTRGYSGKIGNGIYFDGASYLSVADDNQYLDLSNNFTISAWIKPTVLGGRIVDKSTTGSTNGVMFDTYGSVLRVCSQTVNCVSASTTLIANNWYHAAYTFSNQANGLKFYLNGVNDGNFTPGNTTALNNLNFVIGRGSSGGAVAASYFTGVIDEVAVWNRVLTPTEMKQLYLRGAARLKLQVRSCDDSACSGETWKGPDGTNNTYFSELNNNSTPYAGNGDVNPTPPYLVLANFTAAPSANQYFQYRAIFESDFSLPTPSFMPELKSVSIDPVHYNSSSPGVYGTSGLGYYSLASFAETPGAGGCPSGITYNVSTDKINWKYWDGAAWSLSAGTPANANTAAVINTNASSFPHAGVAYIKALLNSTGTSKCELDGIHLGGQN